MDSAHQLLASVQLLGIDVGGSGIKGAPVQLGTGTLLTKRHRIPTPKPARPEAVADVVAEIARHFAWDGPIGCAFPARIKNGVALTAANISKQWIGTDVAALFEARTGCPTVVLNDADAAGVAEMRFGKGRGRHGLVLVLTFGTGIGSALFYDGLLVPGTEFGHVYLHGGGAEDYAANRVRKQEDLSWKVWAGRVQEYLDHIEFVLAPDVIILGGGISRPERSREYLPFLTTGAELQTAALQNEAGIIGAACSAERLVR